MAKGTKKRKRDAPARAAEPATFVPKPRTANDDVWLMAKAVTLVVLGLVIYWPALTGDWLWDDRDLIADNRLINDPDGLWKIWIQPSVMFDFLPLKISVEWIEWRLFGEDTLGYHLISLALHLTSVFLLWRLFFKLGLRCAWLGALIFLVHPVQVESIAWIAELKNTLSLPFFLLAMIAWVNYDARGKRGDYALALGMFLLAMLSKPTMVMFPLVILLYAWWRRSRIGVRDLLRSAPFFAISLGVGVATFFFLSKTVGEQRVVLGGVESRLACAGLSLAFYFSKCVLPVDVMTIYPQWKIDPPQPLQFLPWPILAGVLWFLWTKRASWGRHALLGLGFFLLNLVPFIGLTAGSYMNYTWVMDHLLYIPLIGWIGLAIAAVDHAGSQLAPVTRRLGALLVVLVLAWMTWSSRYQATLYTSLEALWTYNIAGNPGAALPHNDLGYFLERRGDFAGAAEQFRVATELDPRYPDAHHNLALTLLKLGRVAEALPECEISERLDPGNPEEYFNLGIALGKLGRDDEAIQQYRQAQALNPRFVNVYNNLAITLVNMKRLDEALAVIQTGLQNAPGNATLQQDLAEIQQMQKANPPAPVHAPAR